MSAFEDILNEEDDVTEDTPSVETPAAEPSEVTAVAESPAPEQAETSEPVPVAEEAQPITREDGAVWSEKAKRWYLDGKIVSGEAPTVPSEPSAPSVADPAPIVEAPKVEAPIGEPWTVRGGGGKHAIPGAFVTPTGDIVVKPEGQAQVKALIAAGIQHNQNYPRERQSFQQQIRDAEARGEARAGKYNKASVYLYDRLASILSEHPQELDMIRRELAVELKAADLDIPRASAPQDAQPEQIEQAFGATVNGYLDELIEDAPRGVLTPDDVTDLRATFARRMVAYAAEVDGQVMLDTHAMKADFEREVRLAQRAAVKAAEARQQAERKAKAAAFNAANTTSAPAVPPKKPTPKPVHATVPSGKKPSWDQQIKSAWDDDTDE